jgi:hypothetical protein
MMKITSVRAVALSAMILITASSIGSAEHTGMAQAVSIVQLIATPEKYNGKLVLVGGFLRLEFEGDAIYLHEDDYRHGIYANALWVNLDAKTAENTDKLNLHYAFVEGTFDASRHGHGGLFPGTINNITFARIASDRNQ